MSLRHALLGLLAARPSSGYDLTRSFKVSLAHAWSAHHSQIYPVLAELLAAGLIEQESTGPRGRKVYAVTDAGLAEMRRWLTETEPDRASRNEASLRIFFLWLISPEEADAYLRREVEYHRQKLELYEELQRIGGDYVTPSTPLALEGGVRYEKSVLAWLDWTRREVASEED